MKKTSILSLLFILFTISVGQAKVYNNVPVGAYESVLDLNDYKGQPFIKFMKEVAYPEFNRQAANRERGSHIEGIIEGEGVEIKLTDDVTTLHVKYKADWEDKVERSGRSFSAVGTGARIDYVADASYKHYLRTLEPLVRGDEEEVALFYTAILSVLTNSDPSGIALLSTESKQVAADFVAIYVAEQYRRLTATKGKWLGPRHRWDNAVTQVTLLSAFHGGQDYGKRKMFYEGNFTDKVYHQSACLYKAKGQSKKRSETKTRNIRLYDYWQFTVRSECPGRSGVNLTRRDFEKLGRALTRNLKYVDRNAFDNFKFANKGRANIFKTVTKGLLNGWKQVQSEDYVKNLVEVIMLTKTHANELTDRISTYY